MKPTAARQVKRVPRERRMVTGMMGYLAMRVSLMMKKGKRRKDRMIGVGIMCLPERPSRKRSIVEVCRVR